MPNLAGRHMDSTNRWVHRFTEITMESQSLLQEKRLVASNQDPIKGVSSVRGKMFSIRPLG